MEATRLLRRTTLLLGGIWIVSIVAALIIGITAFDDGTNLAWLVQLLAVIIAAIVVALQSKRHKLHLRAFSISICVGLALLYALSLTGFYTKAFVVGEFDAGGTWITDHSVLSAVTDNPNPALIAALFGYSCNGTYGKNCSDNLYGAGVAIAEVVLVGSVATGVVLARQQAARQLSTEK